MKRVYTLWSIFLMLCISSNQNKVYSEECGRIYTFDQTKRKPKSGVRKERLSFGDDTRKIIPIDRNNIVSEKVINLDRINDTIFRLSQNFPPHRYTDQSHSKTIMYDLIKAFTMNINTYKHYSPEIPYFIISFFSFEMKENNIFPSYWDYIIAYHLVVYKKELEEAGHIVKELLSDKTVWFNKTIRNLEVGEEELLLISSRIHTVLQEIANNNLKQANAIDALARIDSALHSYLLFVSLESGDQEQTRFHEKERELPLAGEVISQFPQNYVSKLVGFKDDMLAGMYISPTLNIAYFIIYDIKYERILFKSAMTIFRNQFDMSVVFNDRNEFLMFTTFQGLLEQWDRASHPSFKSRWKKFVVSYEDIKKKITTENQLRSCFDSKGSALIIAGDKGILFWDIEKSKEIDFIPFPVVAKTLYIVDDRELNIISDEGIRFSLKVTEIIQKIHTTRSMFEML